MVINTFNTIELLSMQNYHKNKIKTNNLKSHTKICSLQKNKQFHIIIIVRSKYFLKFKK